MLLILPLSFYLYAHSNSPTELKTKFEDTSTLFSSEV